MSYDKDSFIMGLSVGRMLWRPPGVSAGVDRRIASISIFRPPTKVSYSGGEILDFSGLSVLALDGNGNIIGPLPFYRLSFPITHALTPEQARARDLVYPPFRDNGEVLVKATGCFEADYIGAAESFANGYIDENGLLREVLANYGAGALGHPYIITWETGDGRYEGWSPLNAALFTDIRVGDVVNLDRSVYASVFISFYGRKYQGQPTQLLQYNVDETPGKYRLYEGKRARTETRMELCSLNAVYRTDIPVHYVRSDGVILEDSFSIEIEFS